MLFEKEFRMLRYVRRYIAACIPQHPNKKESGDQDRISNPLLAKDTELRLVIQSIPHRADGLRVRPLCYLCDHHCTEQLDARPFRRPRFACGDPRCCISSDRDHWHGVFLHQESGRRVAIPPGGSVWAGYCTRRVLRDLVSVTNQSRDSRHKKHESEMSPWKPPPLVRP